MLSLFKTVAPKVPEVVVAERPPLPAAKLEKTAVQSMEQSYMDEYAELAGVVGIAPPEIAIESFKAVLHKLDIPIFSLAEVIAYMDEKAAKESKEKAGWEWRPLREKDNLRDVRFGRQASRTGSMSGRDVVSIAASDYYAGPRDETYNAGWGQAGLMQFMGLQGLQGTVPQLPTGQSQAYITSPSSLPYNRTIPLHAVRRIAAIEKEHKGKIGFFVSDYALAPQIRYPDPFLMVVVPNPGVDSGTGRFVIDFWDEPGFGFDKMLKG